MALGAQERLRSLPARFELMQNYPNPLSPTTTIRYGLPDRSEVTIKVYTVLGEEVATLVEGAVAPGYHFAEWKATDRWGRALPPGMYMYGMRAISTKRDVFYQVRKMVLLK